MNRRAILKIVPVIAFTLGAVAAFSLQSFAFNGPSSSGGTGGGFIGVGSAGNVSVGTSTPLGNTMFFVVGSSSNSSYYATQIQNSAAAPLFIVRNDGAIAIATSTLGAGMTNIGGNVTVGGTLTASSLGPSTINANNVSAGTFASSTGGGNFSFPGNVDVASGSYYTYNGNAMAYSKGTSEWFFAGAGSPLTSGSAYDIGIGAGALASDTFSAGGYNVAIGVQALSGSTIGGSNVAIGAAAMEGQNPGNKNTGIGAYALGSLTGNAAIYNIGLGLNAGSGFTTGASNIAIGPNAGIGTGVGSGGGLTGSNNILIGGASGTIYVNPPAVGTSNFLNIANLIYATNIYATTTPTYLGIGTTTPSSALTVSGSYFSIYYANANSTTTTYTVNWNNGNVQSLVLGSSPTFTFTNQQPGGRYILMLVQDGSGSRTVTWPSSVQWAGGTAPTLTTTAKKMDIVTLVCAAVSSTDCYGGANLNYAQ